MDQIAGIANGTVSGTPLNFKTLGIGNGLTVCSSHLTFKECRVMSDSKIMYIRMLWRSTLNILPIPRTTRKLLLSSILTVKMTPSSGTIHWYRRLFITGRTRQCILPMAASTKYDTPSSIPFFLHIHRART